MHLAVPGDGLAVASSDPEPAGAECILNEALPRSAGYALHRHWITRTRFRIDGALRLSPRQIANSVKRCGDEGEPAVALEAYASIAGAHIWDFARLTKLVLFASKIMRILLRVTSLRAIVAGLLVALAVVVAVACGGDDSRYGGKKSGSFQPRSGISWGN